MVKAYDHVCDENCKAIQCPSCKKLKSCVHFYKSKAHKNGLYPVCIDCRKEVSRKQTLKTIDLNSNIDPFLDVSLKRCTTCKIKKHRHDFYKNKTRGDGLAGECKSCHIKRVGRDRRRRAG